MHAAPGNNELSRLLTIHR